MNPDNTVYLFVCIMGIMLIISTVVIVTLLANTYTNRKRISEAEHKINTIKTSAINAMREQWFDELPHYAYRNEIDVEIKFIYPLLRFLGYSENDLQVRYPVTIQVGRQQQPATADWLILRNGKPAFVLEAKKDDQPLNQDVYAQARSYAYGLNLGVYIVTNGKLIEVWERGTERDSCMLQVKISELHSRWNELQTRIGK